MKNAYPYPSTTPPRETILNLTQHPATPDQIAAGVVDLPADVRATVSTFLTFTEPPSADLIRTRASDLACFAWMYSDDADGAVMIGGAPYLMAPLAEALAARGMRPVFAFSERVSEEERLPNGTVVKQSSFRHAGFVDAIL